MQNLNVDSCISNVWQRNSVRIILETVALSTCINGRTLHWIFLCQRNRNVNVQKKVKKVVAEEMRAGWSQQKKKKLSSRLFWTQQVLLLLTWCAALRLYGTLHWQMTVTWPIIVNFIDKLLPGITKLVTHCAKKTNRKENVLCQQVWNTKAESETIYQTY